MSPQHFLECVVAVILSQLHVPATRPCLISPECVHHKILSLLHVAATCPCKMYPRVQAPLILFTDTLTSQSLNVTFFERILWANSLRKDYPGPLTSLEDFAHGEHHNLWTLFPGQVKETKFLGLPRCKNLWSFSLFCHYCVRSIYCFDFFVFFVLRHSWT